MFTTLFRARKTRTYAATAVVLTLAAFLTACGSSTTTKNVPSTATAAAAGHDAHGGMSASSDHDMANMPGMGAGSETGLSATQDGYSFDSSISSLPAGSSKYSFMIMGADQKPVTSYQDDQTVLMHFYAVRSDLTGFQHIHPTLGQDGTWTTELTGLTPGSWRLYSAFIPNSGDGKGMDYVLSRTITVPGEAETRPLPAVSTTTEVDGYTVTIGGAIMAGTAGELTAHITKGGNPVTALEPYLASYAHLTAFHEGDGAFAHLHPKTAVNGLGGPDLTFHAQVPIAGKWRLFLQFQTEGKLHSAEITINVG